MSKKEIKIKDIENAWFLDDSEQRREMVWESLGKGNFKNGIKEVFIYADHLRNEASCCENIITVLLKGIREDKMQSEAELWSSIVDAKN